MSKKDPVDIALVNADDVRNYLRTRRLQFESKKKLGEAHSQTKIEFIAGTGLNKTASAFAERLDRFSPEVRDDVLRSLDKIRDSMDGVWTQETTADMFPDKEPAPTAEVGRIPEGMVSGPDDILAKEQPFQLPTDPEGDHDFEKVERAPATRDKASRKAAIKSELEGMRARKNGGSVGPEAA